MRVLTSVNKRKLAFDAEIVEVHISLPNLNTVEIARVVGCSQSAVCNAISRYYEKPKKSLVLKSKV